MKKKNVLLITVTGVIILAILISCAAFLDRAPSVSERISKSPQYSNGEFRNPDQNIEFSIGTTLTSLWDFVFNKKNTKPKKNLPKQVVDLATFKIRNSNQLRVSWIGHSSLLINIDGLIILTDPVLEMSVSFLGPSRYNGDAPVKAEELAEIDVVLISHDHYDHLNKFTIERIHHKASLFITPLGVGKYLKKWGVSSEKIIELDWWEETEIGNNLAVVCTPAQHFSGRGISDRNKTLWSSFVVESESHRIFFGGDSGYFDGFKEIGRKYGPFDMTFLECGAYNERWANIHMMPEETVQAHLDLKGDILHPIHWGTFDQALHPWNEPMNRLITAAESAGVRTATPIVGSLTIYDTDIPSERWWKIKGVNEIGENNLSK